MGESEVFDEEAEIQIPGVGLQKLSASPGAGADTLLRRIQRQKAEAIPEFRSCL